MPLTLQCACAGNVDVAACVLTELWWEGSVRYTSKGGIDALYGLALMGGSPVGPIASVGAPGDFSISISTSEDFDSLFARLHIDASAAQLAVPGGAAIVEANWWIRAVYECATTGSPAGTPEIFEVFSYARAGEDDYNWIVLDVTLRSYAHTGNSAGVAALYSSAPLATNGASADSGSFDPIPNASIDYERSVPGSVCLCPVGGVPPYFFSAGAGLPSGLTLDPLTGCLSGTPIGAGGTRDVAFKVSDGNRDVATVTCTFMANCADPRSQTPNAFL